ncbi:hypothetical protein Q5752_004766 [Cryptotrichosporon argae]
MGYGIHCGSFLLSAAFSLLLVATLSAPVINNLGFLEVTSSTESLRFGVFGYCNVMGSDSCSSAEVGYNVSTIAGAVSDYTYVNNHLYNVTKAFVLVPIAAGIVLLALLIALASNMLGFIFASLVTFVAFVFSLVATVLLFAVFAVVKHEINDNTSATAKFSAAIWLVLVATIVLLIATFTVLFECCSSRRWAKNNNNDAYAQNGYAGQQPMGQVGGGGRWFGRRQY